MYEGSRLGRRLACVALAMPLLLACNCPRDLDPVSRIQVEDTHVSTWMVFDNAWVGPMKREAPYALCDKSGASIEKQFGKCQTFFDAATTFMPGVLFQLGTVYLPPDHDSDGASTRKHLEKVTLTVEEPDQDSREVDLFEEADADQVPADMTDQIFDWLDVLPMDGDEGTDECVVDARHAYRLFENTHAATGCDPTNPADPMAWDNQWKDRCRRNRALHASFRADRGAITYWTDRQTLYTIAATRKNVAGHTHISYDFNLNKLVSVDVWRDGCWQQRFTHVTNILIEYTSGPYHGGYHDPPMDGGDVGFP